jgi:murein DD-endopeptidase MepM/ murein hydrolase activator NlpD
MKNYLLLGLLFSLYIFVSNSFPQEWKIPGKLSASINGSIITQNSFPEAESISENSKYWCTYGINAVTDEMRELVNFNFYENDKLLFTLSDVPGSDMEISNSGKIVFYDHSKHFLGKLNIHIYSKQGMYLFSKELEGATMFRFSPSGAMFGIRTPEGIHLISLEDGTIQTIEKGFQFAISEDDNLIAVASENNIKIFLDGELHKTISNQMSYPRDIIISFSSKIVAVIDKYNLRAYSLESGSLLFNNKIGGDFSFRELKIIEDKIIVGIHKRNKKESTGLLRAYKLNGYEIDTKICNTKNLQQHDSIKLQKKNNSGYDPIPWPFAPFDSMRTIWNHYEQHQVVPGYPPYLHEGLDLIVPIGEPTYSVIDGYVKMVATGAGAYHWTIAISDTQVAGYSDGWLSAHLIESTIQFDVGDTVNVHDYLGDIIRWLSHNWGHMHLVQVRASGMVWFYEPDKIGMNFNPMLALQPCPDTTAPYIDPVFTWSKFAFAVNESDTYLKPDSLFGKVDIIVKAVDYIGDSEWQQPAYTTWYTIKRISDGEIIKPKTLGHILNHKYPFMDDIQLPPYAGVIYQRDATLTPSNVYNKERNYYHNLTNSNGDSLVELSEKALAFDTDQYPDGIYRVIIEVYDEAGNFDIDSMDVHFKNNPTSTEFDKDNVFTFKLDQNYPNPSNPTTTISYEIPERSIVTIKIYGVLGNEITTLVNEEKAAGYYDIDFDASELSSGIYFYSLQAGDYIETKKMVLMK